MSTLRILTIGDIAGDAGVLTVRHLLPELKQAYMADMVIANGENSHQGRGLNEVIVKNLYKAGVDVITGGDHSFDKHLIFPYWPHDRKLLRPANYPKGAPGHGFGIFPIAGVEVGVLNLRGQAYFQNPIRDPFETAEYLIRQMKERTKFIVVDFHAEATAEKAAMAHFLDGHVSVLYGTHTHVQTADDRILPGGTGFITDLGFTGAHDSVIGMDTAAALRRYQTALPQKYEQATRGHRLNGALFTIDTDTGLCVEIERINTPSPESEEAQAAKNAPAQDASAE
jgi:2',3'-cyclic-nucleotide 2'-phosphodiesterase